MRFDAAYAVARDEAGTGTAAGEHGRVFMKAYLWGITCI